MENQDAIDIANVYIGNDNVVTLLLLFIVVAFLVAAILLRNKINTSNKLFHKLHNDDYYYDPAFRHLPGNIYYKSKK